MWAEQRGECAELCSLPHHLYSPSSYNSRIGNLDTSNVTNVYAGKLHPILADLWRVKRCRLLVHFNKGFDCVKEWRAAGSTWNDAGCPHSTMLHEDCWLQWWMRCILSLTMSCFFSSKYYFRGGNCKNLHCKGQCQPVIHLVVKPSLQTSAGSVATPIEEPLNTGS